MTMTTPEATSRYLGLIEDKTQWTMPDICRALDVRPQTVRAWRKDSLAARRENPLAPPHPHHLPTEDDIVLDRPVWNAGTIRKWAMQTGRMDPSGKALRLKPPGRPRSTRQNLTTAA